MTIETQRHLVLGNISEVVGQTERRKDIPALHGIRGFAAVVVVFAHMKADADIGFVNEQIGSYGVLLFFILSGFLMGHLYLNQPFEKEQVHKYLAARISRVVPLYYLVGMASFIYSRYDSSFPYYMDSIDLARHAVMLDNVSVFWTISPEFQFYFIFPFFWWIFQQPLQKRIIIGIPTALVVLGLIAARYHLPGLLVISKLHIFLLGVAIAYLAPRIRCSLGKQWATILQVCAICILAVLIVPPSHQISQWIFLDGVANRLPRIYYELPRTLLAGFCIFAFGLRDTKFASALFANSFMKRLGLYSFSLYLLHTPIIYAAKRLHIAENLGGFAAACIILTVSFWISALSNKFIENPTKNAAHGMLLATFRRLPHFRNSPA